MLEAAKNILYMYCFSEFEGSAGVIERGYRETGGSREDREA